jgi:hypothetical protein
VAVLTGLFDVLQTFVVGVIGWLAGLLSAGLIQDREQLRRQHAILLTLREEVRRLRSEIGPPPAESLELSIFGSRAVVPTIHPWAQGIIADTAAVDPAIVREFLTLDRLLHNLSVQKSQRDQMSDHVDAQRSAEAAAKRASDSDTSDDTDAFLSYLQKKREREQAERNLERLQRFYEIGHKQVRDVLDELSKLLETSIPTTDAARLSGVWRWGRRVAGVRAKGIRSASEVGNRVDAGHIGEKEPAPTLPPRPEAGS